MTTIDDLLLVPYTEADCWRLSVRARLELFGMRTHGFEQEVSKDDPRACTEAYRDLAPRMEECTPEPGAFAAVFRGALCIHIGVVVYVDRRWQVLETNPDSGPRLKRLHEFLAHNPKVKFYRDKSLS